MRSIQASKQNSKQFPFGMRGVARLSIGVFLCLLSCACAPANTPSPADVTAVEIAKGLPTVDAGTVWDQDGLEVNVVDLVEDTTLPDNVSLVMSLTNQLDQQVHVRSGAVAINGLLVRASLDPFNETQLVIQPHQTATTSLVAFRTDLAACGIDNIESFDFQLLIDTSSSSQITNTGNILVKTGIYGSFSQTDVGMNKVLLDSNGLKISVVSKSNNSPLGLTLLIENQSPFNQDILVDTYTGGPESSIDGRPAEILLGVSLDAGSAIYSDMFADVIGYPDANNNQRDYVFTIKVTIDGSKTTTSSYPITVSLPS